MCPDWQLSKSRASGLIPIVISDPMCHVHGRDHLACQGNDLKTNNKTLSH